MNTKRFLCAALGAVCYFAFLQAQVRTEQTFEKGWKFRLAFRPHAVSFRQGEGGARLVDAAERRENGGRRCKT